MGSHFVPSFLWYRCSLFTIKMAPLHVSHDPGVSEEMMEFSGHGLVCEIGFSMPDVEGWMHTTVSLKAPSFEGGFSCTIEVEEWKGFVQVLRKLDSTAGEKADAVWVNMEENIEFSFSANPRGALEISYRFSPDCFSLGPTLSGTFEADQTFLRRWITEAEAVLSRDH